MKINRLKLIDILRQRIEYAEAKRQEEYARTLDAWNDAKRAYIDRTEAAWLEFTNIIRAKIARDEVITYDDVPLALKSRLWNGITLFDVNEPRVPRLSEQISQLNALIDVLSKASDDEVSTYSLEKMGFKLGKVLQ